VTSDHKFSSAGQVKNHVIAQSHCSFHCQTHYFTSDTISFEMEPWLVSDSVKFSAC